MTTNTGRYCEVAMPGRDSVVDGPRTLPNNWVDYQGNSQKNLNDLDVWNNKGTDGKKSLYDVGWYPYVENDSGSPGGSTYYDRSLSDFTINADTVSRDAIYTQWSIDRVKESKISDVFIQLDQWTTNERAINQKIDQYVRDETEWATNTQIDIEVQTDWNTVANYDTTKPDPLTLPNSYVGKSYVTQGLRLTSENQAATGSGQPAIWDQVIVDNFIAGNRNAADDSSNATAPVKPVYQIRQPVANVSEKFNRVVIWRYDVDDPNPALRRSYAMEMRNRQDSRDLYIFSYTNSTYLTWRKFEDQGNGVWYLEATSAERQYVDTDMSFIFSYGTNPAVEADYFTDRVEFPAGVQVKQILVAWDSV